MMYVIDDAHIVVQRTRCTSVQEVQANEMNDMPRTHILARRDGRCSCSDDGAHRCCRQSTMGDTHYAMNIHVHE